MLLNYIKRGEIKLDFLLTLMFLTSKNIGKAITLLIVSMFLFVQIASASHVHSHADDSPEPNVCAACLASTQDDDDDDDIDLPLTSVLTFLVPNSLELDLVDLSDVKFTICRYHVNGAEPPNLRSSAPRAPPV